MTDSHGGFKTKRYVFCLLMSSITTALAVAQTQPVQSAQPSAQRHRENLKEPLFRVAETTRTSRIKEQHPIDSVIEAIREKLDYFQENVESYSATLVKREQVNNELLDYQFIFLKIRNERTNSALQVVSPFSVYMHFDGPEDLKGREVLWVKGQNKNKLIAHEGSGLIGLLSVWLDPNGQRAMRGQRYPIYRIGLVNLLVEFLDRCEHDKRLGKPEDFQVQVFKEARIRIGSDERVCTCIQVTHPMPQDGFNAHIARIFFDDEYNVPVRYAAWDWPKRNGEKPRIIEEYTYANLELNAGFTDADFSHRNPNYNF